MNHTKEVKTKTKRRTSKTFLGKKFENQGMKKRRENDLAVKGFAKIDLDILSYMLVPIAVTLVFKKITKFAWLGGF